MQCSSDCGSLATENIMYTNLRPHDLAIGWFRRHEQFAKYKLISSRKGYDNL
jgi:hypothetical protein